MVSTNAFKRNLWKDNLRALEQYWPPTWVELGDTGIVLPMLGLGDDGAPNGTSFKTRQRTSSGLEAVFTWSEPPSAFDTPFDPNDPASYQGIVPILSFNGSDEEADSPDAATWSVGNASADESFSLGAWLYVTDTAAIRTVLARDDNNVAREWYLLLLGDDTLSLARFDDSAGVSILVTTDAAIAQGEWIHVVGTSDDSEAHTGMNIYVNGATVAQTQADNASYVASEDTAAVTSLGHRLSAGSLSGPFAGKMAGGPLGPFFTNVELTAAQVKNLYLLGRAALGID